MEVTQEVVRELNQRLQWDRVDIDIPWQVIEYTAEGLRGLIRRCEVRPELLVLPWGVVEGLIDESNRLFEASEDGQHSGMKLEGSHSWEYGYVGKIEGVPVVGTIYLGRSDRAGLLTSAGRPFDIQGENSVWLRTE
jgi:hypothetical protein